MPSLFGQFVSKVQTWQQQQQAATTTTAAAAAAAVVAPSSSSSRLTRLVPPSSSSSSTAAAAVAAGLSFPTTTIPSTLDLQYITHQLLAGSPPLPATVPTYRDTGRDAGGRTPPLGHHHHNSSRNRNNHNHNNNTIATFPATTTTSQQPVLSQQQQQQQQNSEDSEEPAHDRDNHDDDDEPAYRPTKIRRHEGDGSVSSSSSSTSSSVTTTAVRTLPTTAASGMEVDATTELQEQEEKEDGGGATAAQQQEEEEEEEDQDDSDVGAVPELDNEDDSLSFANDNDDDGGASASAGGASSGRPSPTTTTTTTGRPVVTARSTAPTTRVARAARPGMLQRFLESHQLTSSAGNNLRPTTAPATATATAAQDDTSTLGDTSSRGLLSRAATATASLVPPSSRKRGRPTGNSAATLSTFLDQRHKNHALVIFLSDLPPDDRTRLLLRRQIVSLPWKAPGQPASETPTIATLLNICYVLTAWLHHDPDNVAVVTCANGKTRTAIAVACYLKFAALVDTTRQGFDWFLQQRQCLTSVLGGNRPLTATTGPDPLQQLLPASLHTLFRNFDQCIDYGQFLQTKPLLLRAIALQGIPVEDKPCLDLWDAQGRHVYSSHAHLWDDVQATNTPTATTAAHPNKRSAHPRTPRRSPASGDGTAGPLHHAQDENVSHDLLYATTTTTSSSPFYQSQWADDEGFYRVNQVLEGDFCLLCRFGGVHAGDALDSSKIIFRYANTTGFMGAGGTYELPRSRVDLMRRYAHFFDDEEFLVSLVFESHWNCQDPQEASLLLQRQCSSEALPDILKGYAAL